MNLQKKLARKFITAFVTPDIRHLSGKQHFGNAHGRGSTCL